MQTKFVKIKQKLYNICVLLRTGMIRAPTLGVARIFNWGGAQTTTHLQ